MQITRTGEMAVAAMAAKAKAEVEARYVIALNNPRKIMQARSTILDSCKRFEFAKGARWKKPVGGKELSGFSIRFAEEAIKAMTNILVDSMIVWEDDEKRNLRITVTDLETNTTYQDDVVILKVVERKELKQGQESLGQRMNSYGKQVFLVNATEEEMLNKTNAAKSKVIRNSGLRLIPQDILSDAQAQIFATMSDPKNSGDPKQQTKDICDAFAAIGVSPAELERYLKHSLDSVSPGELLDLRSVYTAISDNESSWAEVCPPEAKRPTETAPAEGTLELESAGIEKPFEHLVELAKKDNVSLEQIFHFMKSKGLVATSSIELAQASDSNLRTVIKTWKSVVGKIRAIKV